MRKLLQLLVTIVKRAYADLDSKHASGVPSTVTFIVVVVVVFVLFTGMHIDLEEYVSVDGGRDQGTNVFPPLLRAS